MEIANGGKNYFFCIGCQKSGTTILARVLDQHPKIACLWEAYFFNIDHDKSVFNPNAEAYQRHGFDVEKVKKWHSDLEEINPYSIKSRAHRKLTGRYNFHYTPFMENISEALDDFAARCNAELAGDKWPWYIDFIHQMLAAFPEAKYIYTVRDPRGIWNSAQRFKGRERGDEILEEMLTKDKKITPFLDKPNFMTVRYEDIIIKAEETAKNLYEFLGQDYKPEYLQYSPETDPYPDRWNWVPEAGKPLDPNMTTKWKNLMTPEQIEKVSNHAGWFIEKYNYD